MKLPQLNVPKYELKLLSIDSPVKYRPFLVKEQKMLLMAAESKDKNEMLNSMLDCLNGCVDGVDVRKLPVFDMIMLFLKIRSKSVGERLELRHSCGNVVDGKICDAEVPFVVNLDEVKYVTTESHSQVIELTDSIGVKMKYPVFDDVSKYEDISNDIIKQMDMILGSVDSVFTENEVLDRSQFSDHDLEEFFGSMSAAQLGKIIEFFKTQPRVEAEVATVCKACGHRRDIHLSEFEDFF